MHIPIKYLCAECDSEEPKIIALYTRERYCGRFCLAEGQLKHTRLILRMAAEEVEHG